MPRYDFRTPRLYVAAPLSPGAKLALDGAQANYLRNVLRLQAGAPVLVFNGHEGEWRATLADGGRRSLALVVEERTRAQTAALDLHYLFAPLKHARLDYLVQKAVELGASRLQPVLTRHAQVARVNLERMRANAIEAAEQCGILTLPEIAAPLGVLRLVGCERHFHGVRISELQQGVSVDLETCPHAGAFLFPLPKQRLIGGAAEEDAEFGEAPESAHEGLPLRPPVGIVRGEAGARG